MAWALHVTRLVRDLKRGTGKEALSFSEYFLRREKNQGKHSQRSLGTRGFSLFILAIHIYKNWKVFERL